MPIMTVNSVNMTALEIVEAIETINNVTVMNVWFFLDGTAQVYYISRGGGREVELVEMLWSDDDA